MIILTLFWIILSIMYLLLCIYCFKAYNEVRGLENILIIKESQVIIFPEEKREKKGIKGKRGKGESLLSFLRECFLFSIFSLLKKENEEVVDVAKFFKYSSCINALGFFFAFLAAIASIFL